MLYIQGQDLNDIPDTSVLLPSFEIQQSGVSQSNRIVNGVRSVGYQVRLELKPKRTGKLQIPALSVAGASSQPIIVDVVPRGTPGVAPRDNVFAELVVDNPTPYVQQQVVAELKIFDDGKLASVDPVVTGNSEMQVERLPVGGESLEMRNGQRYRVNTYRYVLFPQRSGELVIDQITVPATIRDRSYGGNLILRNTPTRRIEITTNAVTLNVRPQPAASTADWWLPAEALELNHKWSTDIASATTGEALHLTLEIVALGATASQLPEFEVPRVDGLKIYAEQPELITSPFSPSGDNNAQNNVQSLRQDKWSLIPQRGGRFTLPEIEVKWWDTRNEREQVAVIPAQEIVVDGTAVSLSPNTLSAVPPNAIENNAPDPGTVVSSEPLDQAAQQNDSSSSERIFSVDRQLAEHRVWMPVAVVAVTGWLLTLLLWWKLQRPKPVARGRAEDDASAASVSRAWKALEAASKSDDSSAYAASMLEWANAQWPTQSVRNVQEVGARLNHQELVKQLQALEGARYGGGAEVSVSVIQNTLQQAVANARQQSKAVPDALPDL